MRWWIIALPFCIGAAPDSGPRLALEIGVLSCTLGHAIDPQMSDQAGAVSEAREMLCSFVPAHGGGEETYVGALKSINAGKMLPENVTLLWKVRAPVGTRPTPGLLEQTYAADTATPVDHAMPLLGERNHQIALHTMAENEEASKDHNQRHPRRFAITAIELKLKAATS
jgi:hypothetical protein